MISRQASLTYCSTSNETERTWLVFACANSFISLPTRLLLYSLLCCWLSFMPAHFGSHRLTNLSDSQAKSERETDTCSRIATFIFHYQVRVGVGVGVEVEGLLLEVDSVRRGIKSVAQSQSRRAKNKSESRAKGLGPLPGWVQLNARRLTSSAQIMEPNK